MGNEKQLEKYSVLRSKDLSMKTYKLQGENNVGKPDRIFIYKGRCMLVEFKSLGMKPSKMQKYRIKQLKNAGINAYWVDDKNKLEEYFQELIKSVDE